MSLREQAVACSLFFCSGQGKSSKIAKIAGLIQTSKIRSTKKQIPNKFQ